MYSCVNLKNYFNNKGITCIDNKEKGNLDPFVGLSLPYSHLVSDYVLNKDLEAIPLKFCLDNHWDNMELEGQEILVEEKVYSDIYIVGVSNNGNFYNDISLVDTNDCIVKKRIYLSDLFEEKPSNEEICLISFPYIHTQTGINENLKPKLWFYHIKLVKPLNLKSIIFTENPFMHIFSITLKEGEPNEKQNGA